MGNTRKNLPTKLLGIKQIFSFFSCLLFCFQQLLFISFFTHNTEKMASNKEPNPVVFFDITVGHQNQVISFSFLFFLPLFLILLVDNNREESRWNCLQTNAPKLLKISGNSALGNIVEMENQVIFSLSFSPSFPLYLSLFLSFVFFSYFSSFSFFLSLLFLFSSFFFPSLS